MSALVCRFCTPQANVAAGLQSGEAGQQRRLSGIWIRDARAEPAGLCGEVPPGPGGSMRPGGQVPQGPGGTGASESMGSRAPSARSRSTVAGSARVRRSSQGQPSAVRQLWTPPGQSGPPALRQGERLHAAKFRQQGAEPVKDAGSKWFPPVPPASASAMPSSTRTSTRKCPAPPFPASAACGDLVARQSPGKLRQYGHAEEGILIRSCRTECRK